MAQESAEHDRANRLVQAALVTEMKAAEQAPAVLKLHRERSGYRRSAAADLSKFVLEALREIDPNAMLPPVTGLRIGTPFDGIVTLAREERERTIRCTDFHAAATTSRHVLIAAARSTPCYCADVRWRWTLKVIYTAVWLRGISARSPRS